jgi:hypothetical protein
MLVLIYFFKRAIDAAVPSPARRAGGAKRPVGLERGAFAPAQRTNEPGPTALGSFAVTPLNCGHLPVHRCNDIDKLRNICQSVSVTRNHDCCALRGGENERKSD